jgi:integrase
VPNCTRFDKQELPNIAEHEKAEKGYGETGEPSVRGLELGEFWLREFGAHESGFAITMPSLPPLPRLAVEDLSVVSGFLSSRVPLMQLIAAANRKVTGSIPARFSSDEIGILQEALQKSVEHPADASILSREEIAQRRLLAATRAAASREQHIQTVRAHQLLVYGPLLHRIVVDPHIRIAQHTWEGGDPEFVKLLAKQDPELRAVIKRAETSSTQHNRPGHPSLKVQDYEEYIERLYYAQQALEIKKKNRRASWPEIAHAIGWPLGESETEVKKLKRACRDLENEIDQETLRDLEEYRTQKTPKNPVDVQPTFVEWRKTCHTTHLGNLRPNVRADYDSVARNHLDESSIAMIQIDKLTRSSCQKCLNDAAALGLAYDTVRNVRTVLHKVLEIAKNEGKIMRNPADKLTIPIPATSNDERAAEHTWTHDEVRVFFEAIKGHRLEALFYLAITIGPREAELLGSLWTTIDFKRGTFRISRQLKRLPTADGKKEWALQPIKNHRRRTLKLDDYGLALLQERKVTQEEERQLPGFAARDPFRARGGLVFTSEEGGPIHASSILEIFDRLVKKAGLPPIRFHDLRHTCASIMLADGEAVTTVAAILGHKSPSTTTSIYAHAIRGQTDEAIARHAQRLRREE